MKNNRNERRADCPRYRTGVNALKALLWPRRCVICHSFLEPGADRLCPACVAAIPEPISGDRRGAHYRRWASAFWYEGAIRASILRFKFGGCRFYAHYYGPWLARAVTQCLGTQFDLLTYVAVSPYRRWRRGYDQSALLAQAVGKDLDMTPLPTLRKRSRVKPQSRTIDHAERQQNIRGAFRIVDPEAVRGKRILLIDDVLTTGATVSEASHVLLGAGAKSVDVATLAVTRK
ncbi:MAG: ComF family protein [Oscillospiraceae bacterium]|nr:ComF family protein [Oscillospiraceae bacterium]